MVRCGSNHTCAITDTGEVYSWGKGDAGQLGVGDNTAQLSSPVCSSLHDDITQHESLIVIAGVLQTRVESLAGKFCIAIGCGGEHTIAITRTGELYAWGSNGCGQLGLSDTSPRTSPALVTLGNTLKDEQAVQIACGFYHSVLLTNHGRVFTSGSGAQGELGHGNDKPLRYFSPIKYVIERVGWFIGSLVHWFIGSLVHWFIGSLVHWFIDSLVGWLAQKYRRGSGSCVWPRAYGIAHRNRRRLHLGQWLLRPTRPRYAAKRAITTIGAGTAKQAHSQDCIGCLPYRCHHRYGARQLRHQQSALQLVLTCAISRSVQHLLVG
jgi:hypothetical protein